MPIQIGSYNIIKYDDPGYGRIVIMWVRFGNTNLTIKRYNF